MELKKAKKAFLALIWETIFKSFLSGDFLQIRAENAFFAFFISLKI